MQLQVIGVGEKCREMCKMWKADLEKAEAYWKKNPEKKTTEERYMQKETKTTKWIKGANEEETRKDFIRDLFYSQKLET